MIGRTLSDCRILEKLGSGGMADVYIAEDTELDRKIALKVLPPAMAESEERRARFKREAKAIAALNHPNIVHVYFVEEVERLHFITMELVRGKTLSELIPKRGMPLSLFFQMAIPLADAVSAAHQRGVIHRDLKPDNVMQDEEGRLKILDFGLAKWEQELLAVGTSELPTKSATQEGRIMGTVAYMSPEQARYQSAADLRADLKRLHRDAQKTLELDETVALAHIVLGHSKLGLDWDWPSAEKEFLRALELGPSSATVHSEYAFFHYAMGRKEEALSEARRALELEPLDPRHSWTTGRLLNWFGRHEEAITQLEMALEFAPDHVRVRRDLASSYARLGKDREARTSIAAFHKLKGDEAEVVISAARAFDNGGWDGYLEWRLKQPELNLHWRAVYLAELNREDAALAALEQACEEHHIDLAYMLLGRPSFDFLHDHPRFKDLLRRMNWPDSPNVVSR